ncbi:MAG: peptidylprolyl isomerase [Candidatus Omnitrophica bacterium]|nr:peptidylprolyl isomerase [Candidatus Omnitrophota bacterium]
MLKFLRKNTKIFIWCVVICFVLWGAFSVGIQFSSKDRYAGEVFDKPVTHVEYKQFLRASEIFSNDPRLLDDPNFVKYQTWQNIILDREAKRLKISATDEEVRQELRGLLEAQGISNPTPQVYQRWLEQSRIRMKPREFESMLREVIRIQKLVRRMSQQPVEPPTPEEAKGLFLKDNRKIHLEVVVFPAEEEAQTSAAKWGLLKDWKAVIPSSSGLKATDLGLLSLTELMQQMEIPESVAEELYQLPRGGISTPVPLKKGYAIFVVLEKREADEAAFAGKEKEYEKKILELRKQQNFLEWHFALIQRAKLKDYQPEYDTASDIPEPVPNS